jgi:hypothetical protein
MGESAVRAPTWLLGLSPGRRGHAGVAIRRRRGPSPRRPLPVSPGIILAVVFVAIGAQLTRVIVPWRGNYIVALLCAAAGLLAAELVALGGHGGPALGVVHPVADAAGIIIVEIVGLVLAAPRRLRGR